MAGSPSTRRSPPKRVVIIINSTSGTMQGQDVKAFGAEAAATFRAAGYDALPRITKGRGLMRALKAVAEDPDTFAIVACGGDGTISAAAGLAWQHKKVLGVIPAGTMNLFARALGVPLNPNAAVAALATAPIIKCDIATANGRPFVHQFAVGLQPRLVTERSHYSFGSRIGKMFASVRAALSSVSRPLVFPAVLDHGGKVTRGEFSAIAVSNNTYGTGHLPYPDSVSEGVLGIYCVAPLSAPQMARFVANLAVSNFSGNPDVSVQQAKKDVTLRFERVKGSSRASIDGEIIKLKREVIVQMHHGELKVFKPTAETS